MTDSNTVIGKIRAAIADSYPQANGMAMVDVRQALHALATCQAYLIAGSGTGDRQRLMAAADSILAGTVAKLVLEQHPIVGTAVDVKRSA